MRTSITLLLTCGFILFTSSIWASSITVSGAVSGVWNVDTVKVKDHISIPFNETLTIVPGCKVLFEGYYRFEIMGTLLAIGETEKQIRFETTDTSGFHLPFGSAGSWQGIRMGTGQEKPSILKHCVFKYMKGNLAIDLEYGYSEISQCTFLDNNANALVYVRSKGNKISTSIFSANKSKMILFFAPILGETLLFEGNTITGNDGPAITYQGYVKTTLVLRNNIFWNNNNRANKSDPEIEYKFYDSYGFDTSSLILQNCIIENGEKLPFFNSSCFTTSPRFVNAFLNDFTPSWSNFPVSDVTKSVAIDNGYNASAIDKDGTRRDIGAISFYNINRTKNTWANFYFDSTEGFRSLTVKFLNSSNTVPGQQTTWHWDFGDGNTSQEFSPTHIYQTPGVFSVKLKAIDVDGHIDSLILHNSITVLNASKVSKGEVEDTWKKKNSPYYVYGDIFVPKGKKLTIEPGVIVEFMGSYSFDVYGSLFAEGNGMDSIIFKPHDTSGMKLTAGMNIDYPFADFQRSKGWLGIHVISNTSQKDTFKLSFAKITGIRSGNPNSSQIKGALKLHRISYAEVKSSLFIDNFTTPQNFITSIDTSYRIYATAGISSVGSNPILIDNTFENLYQIGPSGIFAVFSDSIIISGNKFRNLRGTGAEVNNINNFKIEKNIFDSCSIGLRIAYCTATTNKFNLVKSNEFLRSGRAIQGGDIYGVLFTHNTFFRNAADIDPGMSIWGDSIYINNNLFRENKVTGRFGNVGSTCINLFLVKTKTGVIANNTIVDNTGSFYQAIIYGDEDVVIANNILRNSGGNELQGTKFLTSYQFTNFKNTANNNIKGGYASGRANFDKAPDFVDPGANNYRLSATSSSINAGYYDSSLIINLSVDYYGNTRIDPFMNKIDVGCAEHITNKPTTITISADSIKENLPKETLVGNFSSIDADSSDTHVYSFINIPSVENNNSNFIIRKGALYSAKTFKTTESPQKASIRSADNFGAFVDSTFLIYVMSNPVDTSQNIPKDSSNSGDSTRHNKITIYPNPVLTTATISLPEEVTGEWSLYDIHGQRLDVGKLRRKTEINLSRYAKGMYIIQLFDGRKRFSYKVLK